MAGMSDDDLTAAYMLGLHAGPRWIPVGERLPDDETELLVAFEDRSLGVAFAVFHHLDENDGPKWTDGNGIELKQPTHWMPLPAPPEAQRCTPPPQTTPGEGSLQGAGTSERPAPPEAK